MEEGFDRGSEWRIWDFHVHTPASFNWRGSPRLSSPAFDSPEDIAIVDEMIVAMNEAEAEVFVLMDYFTFDGWLALQRRMDMPSAPELKKVVFPGIEIRLASPKTPRLNAHVIFSNEITDTQLNDFKSHLKLHILNQSLSDEALIRYIRQLPKSQLTNVSGDIQTNDKDALVASIEKAELTVESWENAVGMYPEKAIPYLAWSSHGGAEKFTKDNYQYVFSLMQFANIFEVKNQEVANLFQNIETKENKSFLDEFQYSLGDKPCLAVRGSDAHRFKTNQEDRGYSVFPGNRKTWIKADTTFEGLLQAIREPANRSFIGDKPDKVKDIAGNPEKYIDSIEITNKVNNGKWFNSLEQKLNSNLVAVIGNKGSGKSAFIDIISHICKDSSKSNYNNFVKKFSNLKVGDKYKAKLNFLKEDDCFENTLSSHSDNNINRITYIPQGHFEELCNNFTSKAFQSHINDVIYSHIPKDKVSGALDYNDYVAKNESSLDKIILEVKGRIESLSVEKANILKRKKQSSLSKTERKLEIEQEKLLSEKAKLDILKSNIESSLNNPQYKEVQDAYTEVMMVFNQRNIADTEYIEAANRLTKLENSLQELNRIEESFNLQKQSFENEFLVDYEIQVSSVITLNFNSTAIKEEIKSLKEDWELKAQELMSCTEKFTSLNTIYEEKNKILNEHNEELGSRRTEIHDLELLIDKAKQAIINLGIEINTSKVTEERLDFISSELKRESDIIFSSLESKLSKRADIFRSITKEIEEIIKRGIEVKLNFEANITFNKITFKNRLASLVNLRHKALNTSNIDETIDRCLSDGLANNDFKSFPEKFLDFLINIENSLDIDLENILKDKAKLEDVLSFLYSFDYLEIQNIIQYDSVDVNYLSPGQRGELLLILFLLLDKSNNPLLIDQPEENLDNQTIYDILVPIIIEAKKRRQIIMVTHNPNLAVVCDAEQIIYAEFDRDNGKEISYVSGSIENPIIKKHIIDILEGTKPAFINRQRKYGLV